MIASYGARLLLLSLASYFLANLALTLVLRLVLPFLLRVAESMRASRASWFLFWARIAPATLSLLFVLAFCVPSYLWLEPGSVAERTTVAGVLVACFGLALLLGAFARTATALWRSRKYLQTAHTCSAHANESVLVIPSTKPLFALAGLFRARLVVSSDLLHSLSPEQFEMAARHERAHQAGYDNIKKLATILSPLALPFSEGFVTLERQTAKFTEWAADDRAIAGDPEKAVILADALVRVARMNGVRSLSGPDLISTLVSEACSLDDRVLRLLNIRQPAENVRSYRIAFLAAAVISAVLALWIGLPATLSGLHVALEHFFG